jgi:cytochrome o ubiquinol oxidase operon protein cyoD
MARERRKKSRLPRYKLALLLAGAAACVAYLTLNHENRRRLPAHADPVAPGRGRARETTTYVAGYVLALLLTCGAFGLVYLHLLGGRQAFYTVLGLGLAQMIVHFRCFLHIDLRRSARADLQLILFSSLIVALMVGGTLVVLFNLRARMM